MPKGAIGRTYTWRNDLAINDQRLSIAWHHTRQAGRLRHGTPHGLPHHRHQVGYVLELAQRQPVAPLPAAGPQGRIKLRDEPLVDVRVAGDGRDGVGKRARGGVPAGDDHAHRLARLLLVLQALEGVKDDGVVHLALVLIPVVHGLLGILLSISNHICTDTWGRRCDES